MTARALIRISLALLAGLPGCASDPMPAIRAEFLAGDYVQARDRLAELEKSDPGDRQVYQLERSVVEMALHDVDAAEKLLRAARDRLDDLRKSDALSWFGAVLLDDRQLDYAGADYEQVLVRAMLAALDLMRGGTDADAYALQVLERQQEIIESFTDQNGYQPKKAYKLVAFGSYLRGILNEEDPVKLDTARRSFEKAFQLEPDFSFAKEDLERVTHGQHSAKGNGVVHVIALVGLGPFRVETDEPVTRNVLALAQIIWASSRKRASLPNISEVKIPALAFHADNPGSVLVSVNGTEVGATATITDVEETARREFAAMHDEIVARAVLRRAFKIAVTEGVKEVVRSKRGDDDYNPLTDLGISLAGIFWTALEHADLRCWSLLPASFQVTRIEMPAGEHEITLRAAVRGHPVGEPQSVRVLVRDGFNTYVLVQCPTLSGGPPPLTSDPVETTEDSQS